MRIHAIRVCKKEYHKQLRVTGNAAGSARYTKKFCIRDIPDHRTGIRKKEYKDQITEIAAGKLPGAAMIGGTWTFDKDKLRRYIDAKEAECASRTFTNVRVSGGCAPRSTGSNIEKAYELAILKLRGGSETRGSRKSKRAAGAAKGAARGLNA